MIRSSLCVGMLLACCAAPALAQSACLAPFIPEFSRTPVDAKRVEKRIKSWHDCYAAAKAEGLSVDSSANARVIAASKKWQAATLANAHQPELFLKQRTPTE